MMVAGEGMEGRATTEDVVDTEPSMKGMRVLVGDKIITDESFVAISCDCMDHMYNHIKFS